MTPGTAHAVTFTEKEQATLLPIAADTAPLAPYEVAGRTVASLISSGTELALYRSASFPISPGYAAVFAVTAVGQDVADVRAGDLMFGMGPHRSFQRFARADVLPLPPGLSPASAVFARMMGVTMSTLVTTTARPPARVLVSGLGLVGHLAARVLALCGYDVIACDPVEARRGVATRAGIPHVVATPPLDDATIAGHVALVVECSGHEQAVLDGCRIVQKRGEVVLVGVPWERKTNILAHEVLHTVFHNYVVLRSGWEWELPIHPTDFRAGSILANIEAALRWLAERRMVVDDLYTLVSPREAPQAYQDLLHTRSPRLAVVFDWDADSAANRFVDGGRS